MAPGSPAELAAACEFLRSLADCGERTDRAGLLALTGALAEPAAPGAPAPALPVALRALAADAAALAGSAAGIREAAGRDLRQSLAALPDETLAADWRALCRQMADDLAVPPATTLARMRATRDLLLHADNVRGFLVSNPELAAELAARIGQLVRRLAGAPTVRQTYPAVPRIVARASDRYPELVPAGAGRTARPVNVGLLNESTRAGVVMNAVKAPSYLDTDRESLLRYLAAQVYGGGGAHSLFMKTWGAGLAYSNGVGSNPATGRLSYYAERSPDLATTMRFVRRELGAAPHDSALGEYALAQAFGPYRGAERYEARGEAMAADLADGLTPEAVKAFRTALLALRATPDLYAELTARLGSVYGQVVPGVEARADSTGAGAEAVALAAATPGATSSGATSPGAPAPGAPEAQSVVIGPEKQISSYEDYLRESFRRPVPVVRLYPRDFWITLTPGGVPRSQI
jgi:hypothetical protein